MYVQNKYKSIRKKESALKGAQICFFRFIPILPFHPSCSLRACRSKIAFSIIAKNEVCLARGEGGFRPPVQLQIILEEEGTRCCLHVQYVESKLGQNMCKKGDVGKICWNYGGIIPHLLISHFAFFCVTHINMMINVQIFPNLSGTKSRDASRYHFPLKFWFV